MNLARFQNIVNVIKLANTAKLTLNNKFRFSKQRQQIKGFPYVFGGIQKLKKDDTNDKQQFITMIFGDSIYNGFCFAYKQLLKALQEKDQTFLKDDLLQKNLLENIKFPNTQLINDGSKIEAKIGNIYLCMGLQFNRKKHPQRVLLIKKVNNDLFNIRSQNIFDEKGRIIASIIVQMYFTSSIKLINKPFSDPESIAEEDASKREEIKAKQIKQETHMVQFELQNRLGRGQLFSLLFRSGFRNLFNPNKFYQEIMNKILGLDKDYIWRISDIDKILNGNLPNIKDNTEKTD